MHGCYICACVCIWPLVPWGDCLPISHLLVSNQLTTVHKGSRDDDIHASLAQ